MVQTEPVLEDVAVGVTPQTEAEGRLIAANRALLQRIEDLTRAAAAKDRLLATVNHEIRAPLTIVVGLAQTLRSAWDQLDDQDRCGFILKIEQRGLQLAEIVEDLLTLSAAEGHATGGARLCEVETAIRVAIDLTEGPHDVVVTCPRGLVVRAEERRVAQILINFLTNAARYGAPPVEVEARASGEWVEIRVRDHGTGVPPAFVGELFEAFTQVRDTKGRGGAGLGLSIVRQLALAQGGDAWYEDSPPHGSCFGVRLPA